MPRWHWRLRRKRQSIRKWLHRNPRSNSDTAVRYRITLHRRHGSTPPMTGSDAPFIWGGKQWAAVGDAPKLGNGKGKHKFGNGKGKGGGKADAPVGSAIVASLIGGKPLGGKRDGGKSRSPSRSKKGKGKSVGKDGKKDADHVGHAAKAVGHVGKAAVPNAKPAAAPPRQPPSRLRVRGRRRPATRT